MPTRRQRIKDYLRGVQGTPSEIAKEVDASVKAVHDDLEHVAESLEETEETLLVAPPECMECGFDDFDDKVAPSKCPDCKSEQLSEAVFVVEET